MFAQLRTVMGKALRATRIKRYIPPVSDQGTTGMQTDHSVYGSYRTSIYYSRAMAILLQAVRNAKFHVMRKRATGDPVEVESSRFLQFAANVFEGRNLHKLVQSFVFQQKTFGLFLAKIVRQGQGKVPTAIQAVDSSDIVLRQHAGVITAVQVSGTTITEDDLRENFLLYIEPTEDYAWSHSDELKVIGLEKRLRPLFDIELRHAVSTANYLQRRANLSGIFSTGDSARKPSEKEMQKIKNEIISISRGSNKAGGFLVSSGLVYQQIKDDFPSFAEPLQETRDQIFSAVGVPVILSANTESMGYQNTRLAERMFYSTTVNPLLESFAELIGPVVKLLDGPEAYLAVDDATPNDPLEAAEQARLNVNTLLSLNEARESLGYPPVAQGDEIGFSGATPFVQANRSLRARADRKKQVPKKREYAHVVLDELIQGVHR